jgi:AcrR family transcriptional regulator
MTTMSTDYGVTGRVHQKARTRAALVDAARRLVADGITPTVEEAAALARVSRATAYRYFPNQLRLLAAAHPEIEATTLLDDDAPTDPEDRFRTVVDRFTALIEATEPQQRTMLRLALEGDLATPPRGLLRQGRAVGWIEDAVAPLESTMSAAQRHQLVLALRAATGIESRVWLTDMAELEPSAVTELQRWIAQAIWEHAQAHPPPAP